MPHPSNFFDFCDERCTGNEQRRDAPPPPPSHGACGMVPLVPENTYMIQA